MLQPQVYVGCFAPEKAGFVYHMESRVLGTDSVAINVSLNGITPYQIDSLKYCAMVPPQANARVTGNFFPLIDSKNLESTLILEKQK